MTARAAETGEIQRMSREALRRDYRGCPLCGRIDGCMQVNDELSLSCGEHRWFTWPAQPKPKP